MARLTPMLIFALALMLAAPASAEIVWSGAMAFRVDTGVETPLVLFGFNPQPEPPPEALVSQRFDPAAAVQELSGIQPQPFQLYLASEAGTFSVPPEPVEDFESVEIVFTTESGIDLTFVVTLTPSGDGDASEGISDPLFFNPQPEPPPQFDPAGLLFAFEGLTSGGDVSATLQVLDESQVPLEMTPVAAVPLAGLPAAVALVVLLGLAGGFAASALLGLQRVR